MRAAIDPLGQHAREIALAGAEYVGEALHAPGHLGLNARHLLHLLRQMPLAGGARQPHGDKDDEEKTPRAPARAR